MLTLNKTNHSIRFNSRYEELKTKLVNAADQGIEYPVILVQGDSFSDAAALIRKANEELGTTTCYRGQRSLGNGSIENKFCISNK